MEEFNQLIFWQKSHLFALEIYKISEKFLDYELYGITSQIRRGALSVPNNFAEGCGRESKRELRRFLVIASGSIVEVEYLLFFVFDLKLISQESYTSLLEKAVSIKMKLTAYKNKIV